MKRANRQKQTIALAYGEIEGIGTEVFQIGTELLVPVVHKDNPLTLLSAELAEAVLSGQIKTWEAATEFCPECFFISGMKGDINLYTFTPGTPLYEATSLILRKQQTFILRSSAGAQFSGDPRGAQAGSAGVDHYAQFMGGFDD